jgi:uncharacterized membrane protein YGL010W
MKKGEMKVSLLTALVFNAFYVPVNFVFGLTWLQIMMLSVLSFPLDFVFGLAVTKLLQWLDWIEVDENGGE